MPRPTPRRTLRPLALALGVPLVLAACRAERVLRVTSHPPGAEVWVDETHRGVTPLDLEFHHYGPRRITLRRDGFGTATMRVDVEPPWYALFPLDVVSEVLIPVGWRDAHSAHAVLRPGSSEVPTPVLRSVLDRAEALRRAGPRGPGELPPVVAREREEEPPPEPPR